MIFGHFLVSAKIVLFLEKFLNTFCHEMKALSKKITEKLAGSEEKNKHTRHP